jgi:hypothetical protein
MLQLYDPDRKCSESRQPQSRMQVGTLFQQFQAIAIFLGDEDRHQNREQAWRQARIQSQSAARRRA